MPHLEVDSSVQQLKEGLQVSDLRPVASSEVPSSLEVQLGSPRHDVYHDLHESLLAERVAGVLEGIHVR